MNKASKISFSRIILTIIILIILLFPFDSTEISIPNIFINEKLVINIRFIIAGILFVIATITDVIDGKIAKKHNQITEFGGMLDKIADNFLVINVLIVLSTKGFINPIIIITLISNNIFYIAFKTKIVNQNIAIEKSSFNKIAKFILSFGITLTLFYNLPFELYNLKIAELCLIIATIMYIIKTTFLFKKYKKEIIS